MLCTVTCKYANASQFMEIQIYLYGFIHTQLTNRYTDMHIFIPPMLLLLKQWNSDQIIVLCTRLEPFIWIITLLSHWVIKSWVACKFSKVLLLLLSLLLLPMKLWLRCSLSIATKILVHRLEINVCNLWKRKLISKAIRNFILGIYNVFHLLLEII